MILPIKAFGAGTQPLCLGVPPKIGITTGPALPRLPAWMCEAVGVPIPDQLRLKQTFPDDCLSVIVADPLPLGLPFGDSWPPVILTVKVLLPAAEEETAARSSAATIARDTEKSFLFMRGSSRAAGRGSHGT